MDIEEILKKVRSGEMGVNDALKELRDFPFKDMGFAKIDFHRKLRRGIPEAIYAPGKTMEQITCIVREMFGKEKIFITKAPEGLYEELKDLENCRYYPECSMIVVGRKAQKTRKGACVVISGGTGDIPVAEEAAVTLEELGNEVTRVYDAGAAGIHRLMNHGDTLWDARVVVAVAGMDGILPTIVSNFTSAVVIAVPTSIGYGTGMNGVAALMAMLNSCSPGVVVVNIDNGFGAGVAAHLIVRERP